MKKQFFILFFSALLLTGITAHAQKDAAKTTIGSAILKQEGTDENSYNNGPYSYEMVYDMPGATKAELYKKAKSWVLSNLKAGAQNQFDDNEQNEIHTTVALAYPDNINSGMINQVVHFKLNLSFKENKYRLSATDFVYQCNETGGAPHTVPLHNIKPVSKRGMSRVYTAFDESFLDLVNSLKSSMDKKSSDW